MEAESLGFRPLLQTLQSEDTEESVTSEVEALSLDSLYALSTLSADTPDRCTLKSGVTLDEFLALVNGKTDRTKGKLMFADGSIIIHELPNYPPHGLAAGALFGQFYILLHATCDCGIDSQFTSFQAGGWSKQPDGYITPKGKPRPGAASPLRATSLGTAWPNVIFEIASSDTMLDVLADCALWLGPQTTVQAVIVIKLYAIKPAAGNFTLPMLALRFRRAAPLVPDVLISFGTRHLHPATTAWLAGKPGWPAVTGYIVGAAGCTGAGLVGYQLPLLSADIYAGIAAPPAGAPVISYLFYIVTCPPTIKYP